MYRQMRKSRVELYARDLVVISHSQKIKYIQWKESKSKKLTKY